MKERTTLDKTTYFDGLITTYDNVFTPSTISALESNIHDVRFKYGTRDNPDQPPTGLQCFEFEDYHSWSTLQNVVNEKLDDLEGLEYRRSNLNFFATGEDAYYHKDDCDWTLLYYCNSKWAPDEKGETKFFITKEDLGDYKLQDVKGNTDPLVLCIAPIPGRFCFFKSSINHSATGFRSTARFVPALKFVEAGKGQGTGHIVQKGNQDLIQIRRNYD